MTADRARAPRPQRAAAPGACKAKATASHGVVFLAGVAAGMALHEDAPPVGPDVHLCLDSEASPACAYEHEPSAGL